MKEGKVKEIIGGFQKKIDAALDKLIDKLWEKGKGDEIREKAEEIGNKAMEPARKAGRKVKAGAKKAASTVAEKAKPEEEKQALAKVKQVEAELKSGGDFAEIAKKHSERRAPRRAVLFLINQVK